MEEEEANYCVPEIMEVTVEGRKIKFEVDIAASSTIIPRDWFCKLFPHITLSWDNKKFKAIFGEVSSGISKAYVQVKNKGDWLG